MKATALLASSAIGVLFLSGCGATETGSSSIDSASSAQSITLDGSSTVGPFAEAAAELFMEQNPGETVTVGISGTGGGFEKFCNGETDGSNASRDIKSEESDLCAENGIDFGRITVANDALSVIVNQENSLQCISVDSLRALWELDSAVSTWGEIPGVDAGSLASEAVTLYGPGTDSGTFDFFTDEINGESGNIRTDYNNIGEDDNQAVQGVSGNVGAMAFIPYSFYQEYADTVKGLAIDNGSGCVEPTIDNLLSEKYEPLGRQLFMFPSVEALNRPGVAAFYEFAITDNDAIASASGLVPLTAEQKTEQLEVVAELIK